MAPGCDKFRYLFVSIQAMHARSAESTSLMMLVAPLVMRHSELSLVR